MAFRKSPHASSIRIHRPDMERAALERLEHHRISLRGPGGTRGLEELLRESGGCSASDWKAPQDALKLDDELAVIRRDCRRDHHCRRRTHCLSAAPLFFLHFLCFPLTLCPEFGRVLDGLLQKCRANQ